MSAYMVDREHIQYLVSAACTYKLRWFYKGAWNSFENYDREAATRLGQLLWDANLKSIHARYPDTIDNPRNLPGTIGETYIYSHKPIRGSFNPVQVFKSIRCLEYQSCEYQEWEDSEAYAALAALTDATISSLPGYEDAEWGAPKFAEKKVKNV